MLMLVQEHFSSIMDLKMRTTTLFCSVSQEHSELCLLKYGAEHLVSLLKDLTQLQLKGFTKRLKQLKLIDYMLKLSSDFI